jgi:hypothetical protein
VTGSFNRKKKAADPVGNNGHVFLSFRSMLSTSLLTSERIDAAVSFTAETVFRVTETEREKSSAAPLILWEDSLIRIEGFILGRFGYNLYLNF